MCNSVLFHIADSVHHRSSAWKPTW